MLKIYNTLVRKKEEFKPWNYPEVNIYACGVTVYDDCHLGHGRSVYIFETIRNFLIFSGYRVKFVRNITDVDDKMIARAREWSKDEGISLKESFDKVRKYYIKSYYSDLAAMDLNKADIEPLVTENIPEMIKFIERLIKKGFAYKRGGNIYFSVRKFHNYGKLSGKKIDDLFSGVRIKPDPLKADSLDFALWKEKKEDEPFWLSPFGEGRPGWHIECSVMANKYLGRALDIHGGGKDLIFPHHENEIAQSEALLEDDFSHYWMHHGLLTVNAQKMSKSSGNFITLKEAIKKYSPAVLKLIYLSAHYRMPLDFSEEKIKEAKRIKQRLIIFIKQLNSRLNTDSIEKSILDYKKEFSYKEFKLIVDKFTRSMNDDFNMPVAFSVIFDIIRAVNYNLDRDKQFFLEAKVLFYNILKVFSLDSLAKEISLKSQDVIVLSGSITAKMIETKITQRLKLRKEKKFAEADRVRQQLIKQGIILEDQSDGKTIWYHK